MALSNRRAPLGVAPLLYLFLHVPTAGAAPILWDVDPTLSAVTLAMPDQAVSLNGTNATIRVRNQSSASGGNNVWNTGNSAFLDGTIPTDYVDGASIEFLGGADLFGLTSGSYRPNPAAFNPANTNAENPDGQYGNTTTAPGVFGARVRASVSILTVDAAYVNFLDALFDVFSGALSVTGSSFSATTVGFGFAETLVAFDGLSIIIVGQPIPDTPGGLIEDVYGTNTAALGTITSPDPIGDPNLRMLSIPLSVPFVLQLEGINLNASLTGQIVAFATLAVPEAEVLWLLASGLVCLTAARRGRLLPPA